MSVLNRIMTALCLRKPDTDHIEKQMDGVDPILRASAVNTGKVIPCGLHSRAMVGLDTQQDTGDTA